MIYFYFLQSDWLQQRAALRYLDRGPKELFFSDKPRARSVCEDNFQTQNTTQKV
jgi:hypothetical protein